MVSKLSKGLQPLASCKIYVQFSFAIIRHRPTTRVLRVWKDEVFSTGRLDHDKIISNISSLPTGRQEVYTVFKEVLSGELLVSSGYSRSGVG